jgi:hypothetical protein
MSNLIQFNRGTFRYQEFTSSGTFTWPGGVDGVWVFLVGGGGYHNNINSVASGAGGVGGGGYCLVIWIGP